MTLDLTDKERALFKQWERFEGKAPTKAIVICFVTIIYKLHAAKEKAEFYREHFGCAVREHFLEHGWSEKELDDPRFNLVACYNPRHTWTDEQWLEASKDNLEAKA
jgi:hypothetical protein|tara:strand:- start:432 stop:749 length:318 start_codon:yes stop_codon:yes gene_type:complete